MRVMIVGPYPKVAARIDGGVSAATVYLSQALARESGVDLVGVRIDGRPCSAGPAEDFGWPVVDIELRRFSVSTAFRRQLREFHAVLHRFKPDVIHAQGADAAGYLAVKSGYPAVVTVHGILAECARYQSGFARRLREYVQARITERLTIERARHIIAISPYVGKYYSGRMRGAVYDVPNAVAPSFFEVNRRPESGRVLFAGRVSRGKGVADLVRAIAQQPQSVGRVVLAGMLPEGEFKAQLLSEISSSRLSEKFEFKGFLDEQAVLDEFAKATALVLPSYQETAPMVVQQAMAAGLPVVATRVGGIPDLIQHDVSGLLCNPGDVLALGNMLRRLQEDPHLGLRLATAARAKALANFTADGVARSTMTVYRSMLAAA